MTLQVYSELWARGLAFYLFSYWWVWVPPLFGAIYFTAKQRKRIALLNVGMLVLATLVVPATISKLRYDRIFSPEAQEQSVAYLMVTSNGEARTLQKRELVNLVSSITEWARVGSLDPMARDQCIKHRIQANATGYMIEAIYNGDQQASIMASIIKLAQAECKPGIQ